jgi:hypothetical protein
MEIPRRYAQIRQLLPDEVTFGVGGICFYPLDGIPAMQVGYAFTPDGQSLVSNQPGDWQPTWLVIGHDLGLGDPIFLDAASPQLEVLTAMHGMGRWEALPAAASLDALIQCVNEFARVAVSRRDPLERAANPLNDAQRRAYLDRIAAANGTTTAPEFWDVLLEC